MSLYQDQWKWICILDIFFIGISTLIRKSFAIKVKRVFLKYRISQKLFSKWPIKSTRISYVFLWIRLAKYFIFLIRMILLISNKFRVILHRVLIFILFNFISLFIIIIKIKTRFYPLSIFLMILFKFLSCCPLLKKNHSHKNYSFCKNSLNYLIKVYRLMFISLFLEVIIVNINFIY